MDLEKVANWRYHRKQIVEKKENKTAKTNNY